MSLINVTDLTFAYDGSYHNIFENVSFQLDTDWKLGFTGRNGRGKTTFLNLLMGKYQYSGNISAGVSFEYFPYLVPDKSLDTISIVEAMLPGTEEWRIFKELNLLQVSPDVLYRPFCTLSGGEQTKVLLASLFLRENSFLLIDEPTNHLDMAGRKLVSDYLNSKKGFILVSHDRAFLDGCIDHVLSINRADIEIQKGNFSSWNHNNKLKENFELNQNKRLKKEIARMEEAAKRTADWSDKTESSKFGQGPCDRGFIGSKAARMMKRSKAIENRQLTAAEEKSKLLRNIETSDSLKIHPLKHHCQTLVTLENVSISYPDNAVCEGVSFTVCRGEKVALQGRNGCGKSSILKLICGEDIPHSGMVQTASGLLVSYVCQDSSLPGGNLSDYSAESGIDESLFKAILRKLGFERVQFEKDMRDFSAGQKKKVLLAHSLCQRAHLYIWDEPLNYIDIISRIQIEELLRENDVSILFVEHDSQFCDGIAAKTVYL